MSDRKTERWIKENVEAIAIAIVMALVIRQFAIEAFKIPTELMAPTLLGDVRGGGTGDRILVYKVPYLLVGPERWDVVVFKYPLNISKNYIKRLVGLGGETIEIVDGDVIIDGSIARKPAHVRDVMLLPEFPGAMGPAAIRTAWDFDGDQWRRTGETEFEADAKDGTASCRYSRDYVGGDVRLRVSVTPKSDGEVFARILENGVRFELSLVVGEGTSHLTVDGTRHDIPDVRLTADRESSVTFLNVDDALEIRVDGTTYRHEYESIATRAGQDSVAFGVRSGSAAFAGISLERDVHYGGMSPRELEIPEDHFFVLGDNTNNSQDSRRWKLNVAKLEDGRVIEWDSEQREIDMSQRPPDEPGYRVKMDRNGIWRKWRESDEVGGHSVRAAQFVPGEFMIGKAFFVFWPMNPFSDQFRLKFIR